MRVWIATLIICAIAPLGLWLAQRVWVGRFSVGNYSYHFDSGSITQQTIRKGLDNALAAARMIPSDWVMVGEWPSFGESPMQSNDLRLTLSNRAFRTYYLYVDVRCAGWTNTIWYDIHRSK